MLYLPNFLIIGAAKCGTTSLYHYLKYHPQIFLPKRKEINFFDYDPNYIVGRPHYAKTEEEYSDFFKGSINYKAIGEITPAYMNSEIAPQKIHKFIPDVKLIAILRNPADRAYSKYLMNVRLQKNVGSFDDEIKKQNIPIIDEGLYFNRLSPFYSVFDKSQIKILFYEDMNNRFNDFFKELLEFLAVDTNYLPDPTVKHAEATDIQNKYLSKFKNSQFFRFSIKPLLPQHVLNLLIKVKSKNTKKPSALTKTTRLELIKIFSDDIDKLQDLIGTDLSRWKVIE